MVVTPVDLRFLLHRIAVGEKSTPGRSISRAQSYSLIVNLYTGNKCISVFSANKLASDAYGSRRIRDVDGLIVFITRCNLNRCMCLGGGGAANH